MNAFFFFFQQNFSYMFGQYKKCSQTPVDGEQPLFPAKKYIPLFLLSVAMAAVVVQSLAQVSVGDCMASGHIDFSYNDQENRFWKGASEENELLFSRVQYKASVHVLSFRRG